MDENEGKLITIYYFLKKNTKYTCCTICDLVPYKFENIHGIKPQIEGTVRHATLIQLKRSAYSNRNMRTRSYFLVRTTFSPYKKSRSLALRTNEIPLYLFLLSNSVLNLKQNCFFHFILDN